MNACLRLVTLAVCPVLAACLGAPGDEISVSLELQAQDVRSLPVLTSGATVLCCTSAAADSHGELAVKVHIDGADSVTFRELTVQMHLDGAPLDVMVVRQQTPRDDLTAGPTASRIEDGDVLRVHVRTRALDSLVLPEGVPYDADLSLRWDEDSIDPVRLTGSAELELGALVAAAVDSGNFAFLFQPSEVLEQPRVISGGQFRAAVEVTSGLAMELVAVRAHVAYFGQDEGTPTFGVANTSRLATQIGGGPSGYYVEPGEVLEVYTSSEPTGAPAPYDRTGYFSGRYAGPGKAVVTVEIDTRPDPERLDVDTNLVVFAADVR